MPTADDFTALVDNCDWTWTSRNGVDGYEVRGRGDYAESSIFLPAAGHGDGTGLYDSGSYGRCWSSTPEWPNTSSARYLYFNSDVFYRNSSYRYRGFSVRPVRPPAE